MYAYNKNGIYIYDNKFIYNGIDLSNLVVVESVTRPLFPTIINEGVFIDGKAGQSLKRSVIDNKLIQVDIRIIEREKSQREAVIKQLATALYSPTPKKLELNDTDLFNYAQITSTTDLLNTAGTRSITLMFECFDPFDYGQYKQFGNGEAFTNTGYSAPPVIFCNTNETDIIQVKQRNKVIMTINHSIQESKVLIIDSEKKKVTLNGASIMKFITLDSDFPEIDSGLNEIEVTNVSGVSIRYRERWL